MPSKLNKKNLLFESELAMQTMLFAVPKSRLSAKLATAIAGTLGKPSKMPGLSYGISAKLCNVGAKLAKVPGSVCAGCYALKANYQYPSVRQAHEKRAAGLSSVSWADSMIKLIGRSGETYFRWHDSGDIQNFQHLLDIVRIADALPGVRFWVPTREKKLVRQYLDAFGAFPENLCVRLSAAMIDSEAPAGFENTSTVHAGRDPVGFACKAPTQGNKCDECRACWDKSIKNISYRVH
jgi:hypothetical protein